MILKRIYFCSYILPNLQLGFASSGAGGWLSACFLRWCPATMARVMKKEARETGAATTQPPTSKGLPTEKKVVQCLQAAPPHRMWLNGGGHSCGELSSQ